MGRGLLDCDSGGLLGDVGVVTELSHASVLVHDVRDSAGPGWVIDRVLVAGVMPGIARVQLGLQKLSGWVMVRHDASLEDGLGLAQQLSHSASCVIVDNLSEVRGLNGEVVLSLDAPEVYADRLSGLHHGRHLGQP